MFVDDVSIKCKFQYRARQKTCAYNVVHADLFVQTIYERIYLIRAVYFPIVCRLVLHFHSVALAVLVMTRSFVLTWLLYDASSLNEPIEESVR